MASLPPEPTLPRNHGDRATLAPAALVQAWAALHRQADALSGLAGIAPDSARATAPPADLIASARPWQHTLAAQGIEDIAAMLDSGLAALTILSARGQDTTAPALALWREFHAARDAVRAVLGASATA